MLFYKNKLILKRWRYEKYYLKFNLLNVVFFNLFYCFKGGKGMFFVVCEIRSSVKLMLMGILWLEFIFGDVCVYFILGFIRFYKRVE